MSALVLDCSTALSWVLPDEREDGQGEVERMVARDGAVAPSHWPLEVANALTMAARRGRIDRTYRDLVLADLAALPVDLDQETAAHAWGASLRLAEEFRLTVYDAAYVELARRRALPLATLDSALERAALDLGLAVV